MMGEIRDAIQAAEKSGRRTMLMRVKSGDASRYVTWPVARGQPSCANYTRFPQSNTTGS